MGWKHQFFAEEAVGNSAGRDGRRRPSAAVLGPVSLTALGIGAIIGAGIFAITGRVAAEDAGPAIILSFIVAGIACGFAALCYSEFAVLAPVAGSAYTYTYATLGEIWAWAIGWDLILEYAMSCSVVAAHFGALSRRIPDHDDWLAYPAAIAFRSVYGGHHRWPTGAGLVQSAGRTDHGRNHHGPGRRHSRKCHHECRACGRENRGRAVRDFHWLALCQRLELDCGSSRRAQSDGSRRLSAGPQSADCQTGQTGRSGEITDGKEFLKKNPELAKTLPAVERTMVEKLPSEGGKWGLLGVLGIKRWLQPLDDSWRSPFLPYGLSGLMVGAAMVFFAYIGFDAISTHSEEAKNPQRDVPLGILLSLAVCTVLYILVSAVITGMEPYPQIDPGCRGHGISQAGRPRPKLTVDSGGGIDRGRGAGRHDQRAAGDVSEPGSRVSGDRPRRPAAAWNLRRHPPAFLYAVPFDHPDRHPDQPGFRTDTDSQAGRDGQYRDADGLRAGLRLGVDPALYATRGCAAVSLSSDLHRGPRGILVNVLLMLFLPIDTWLRLADLAVAGDDYLHVLYGRRHSVLGHELERQLKTQGLSPTDAPIDA